MPLPRHASVADRWRPGYYDRLLFPGPSLAEDPKTPLATADVAAQLYSMFWYYAAQADGQTGVQP